MRAMAVLLVIGTLAGCVPPPSEAAPLGGTVAIEATPVPLRSGHPEQLSIGALEYRGGLELASPDGRFGGWSGLRVASDGSRLVAVSDNGFRLDVALHYDGRSWLSGIGEARITALRDEQGRSLARRSAGNAEGLEWREDGRMIVAFELQPRLLAYPPANGVPTRLPSPAGLDLAPANEGIEALTGLTDGRLLALTEGLRVEGGLRGWVGDGLDKAGDGARLSWVPVVWHASEGFQPSDAAPMPDGDVLVLERRVLPPGVRIRRLPARALARDVGGGTVLDGEEIARLDGAVTFDNMEGIAARREVGGGTLVYLLSDDNFAFYQRTLLMMFRLAR